MAATAIFLHRIFVAQSDDTTINMYDIVKVEKKTVLARRRQRTFDAVHKIWIIADDYSRRARSQPPKKPNKIKWNEIDDKGDRKRKQCQNHTLDITSTSQFEVWARQKGLSVR